MEGRSFEQGGWTVSSPEVPSIFTCAVTLGRLVVFPAEMKKHKDLKNRILLSIAGFSFILHSCRNFSDYCFARYGYRWLQASWAQRVVGWPEVLQSTVQAARQRLWAGCKGIKVPVLTVPVVREAGCGTLRSHTALNANREGGT